MKNFLTACTILCFSFLINMANMAYAEMIQFEFSGEINYATFSNPPSSFNGSFSFESEIAPQADAGYAKFYTDPSSTLMFDYSIADHLGINTYDVSDYTIKSIQVYDNYDNSSFRGVHDLFQFIHYSPTSATISEVLIQLVDTDAEAFSDFSLPTILNINDFEEAWLEVAYADGNSFRGAITEISPVPEPSTFLLLGGGLAGLAFAVRRRRKE